MRLKWSFLAPWVFAVLGGVALGPPMGLIARNLSALSEGHAISTAEIVIGVTLFGLVLCVGRWLGARPSRPGDRDK